MNDGDLYYYNIKGLMIPHHDVSLSLTSDIDRFIDGIEPLTANLDDSWNKGNLTDFTANMEKIQALLRLVYAKWHEADGNMLMRTARNEGLAQCRQILRQFIADLLTLSIEMQKAQSQQTAGAQHQNTETEEHEEIAHHLSAIGKLINIAEYDKALGVINDMQQKASLISAKPKLAEIAKRVGTHQYAEAIGLSKELYKEYVGQINRAGSDSEALKVVFAVDDRQEILASVSAALSGYYKVLGAPGGEMALKVIKQQKIDLFILDIDMPGMDGFELTERIRAEKGYEQTPIMFLTGTSSRERILKSMKLGIRDFVVKPAYSETLLAKVGKYLI